MGTNWVHTNSVYSMWFCKAVNEIEHTEMLIKRRNKRKEKKKKSKNSMNHTSEWLCDESMAYVLDVCVCGQESERGIFFSLSLCHTYSVHKHIQTAINYKQATKY